MESACLWSTLVHVRGNGPDQFGFYPKSSTASRTSCARISLHDYWMKSFDHPRVSSLQIIAYDFSKAFDRLRYEIILKRLFACSIPTSISRELQVTFRIEVSV